MNEKADRNGNGIPASQSFPDSSEAGALAALAWMGIAISPFLGLGLVPALLLRQSATLALDAAESAHERQQNEALDRYKNLIENGAERMLAPLLEKKPENLTDEERIRLAMLDDQGLIDEKTAALIPADMKADILRTQLVIAAAQSGFSCIRLVDKENFFFPRILAQHKTDESSLDRLRVEREALRGKIGLNRNGADIADALSQKVTGELAQAAVEKLSSRAGSTALSLLSDAPDLNRAWSIVAAEKPASNPVEFLEQRVRKLLPVYEAGSNTVRMASSYALKQDGITPKHLIINKPGGGTRHIVVAPG